MRYYFNAINNKKSWINKGLELHGQAVLVINTQFKGLIAPKVKNHPVQDGLKVRRGQVIYENAGITIVDKQKSRMFYVPYDALFAVLLVDEKWRPIHHVAWLSYTPPSVKEQWRNRIKVHHRRMINHPIIQLEWQTTMREYNEYRASYQ